MVEEEQSFLRIEAPALQVSLAEDSAAVLTLPPNNVSIKLFREFMRFNP